VVGIIGPEWVALNPATYGYGGSGVAVALGTDPSVVVHEIGHVLRRRHNPCAGGAYDPDYPQRWPRSAGALDDVGFRVGDDDGVGSAEALSPDVYLDYMGAADCRPAWSSAYGWTVAMRNARSRAYRRRSACPCTHMLLDVSVTGPDSVELGPSHVVKARPPAPLGPPSAYSVELRDGAKVLARRVLHELDLAEELSGPFPARFIEAIPWNPAATELRVRHGSRVIDTVELAAAPPSLANVVVVPDATGAEVELSWDEDPDPDVHHLVRFSNDGRDWIALSNDMTDNPVQLDLRDLPTGPACVIEVSASQNGRTAVIRSAPFARDPVAPRAVIALPRRRADGSPVPLELDDQVSLTGYGFSPDAPPIRDDSLTWVVEDAGGGETALGSGGSLLVPARALPAGTSRIHLRLAGGTDDLIEVERPAGGGPGPGPVGGP
jgi:hypothetical protein